MRAFGDEFDRFAFRIDRTNVQGVVDKDARGGAMAMLLATEMAGLQ